MNLLSSNLYSENYTNNFQVLSFFCAYSLSDLHPVHHPPQPNPQEHYGHVPGFLQVSFSDHGRSDVHYDYGYGRRNHLYVPIGYPHHQPHHY